MSLRYIAGYSLLFLARLLRKVHELMWRVASLPGQFALIIWTPKEIDRYSRADWNSRPVVRTYADLDDWIGTVEQLLVERYFTNKGELLNVACGAGREALLLARRGLRVTACDWSPRMIAEAHRRAREANLPVRFAVADLYDLTYPEHAFDYLLLTNIAYSYLFPKWRRARFLRQAYSVLKPGGSFIVSFQAEDGSPAPRGLLLQLFGRLRRCAPFNRDYEPGDGFSGSFVHFFQAEELKQEFKEAQFLIKDWLWNLGFAVLAKP
jgi:SAM-dependent methyltransferase